MNVDGRFGNKGLYKYAISNPWNFFIMKFLKSLKMNFSKSFILVFLVSNARESFSLTFLPQLALMSTTIVTK